MPSHRVLLPLALLIASLVACSTGGDKQEAYLGARAERPLEVPPDLTAPNSREALTIPDVAPREVSLAGGGIEANGAARVMRDGAVRWIEVDVPPREVWAQAKRFLQAQGESVAVESPRLGILETDWRETRPTGFLAKLMNNRTGFLDKYRLRLESAADGRRTEIYLSHRGMQETGESEEGGEPTWASRPSDPELEAEMLQKLLVFLGGETEDAEREALGLAELVTDDGRQALVLSEGFPRAWRRMGLALDRIGVIVADRNRSEGVYYIRLPDSYIAAERIPKSTPRELSIAMQEREGRTWAQVRAEEGGGVDSEIGQRLLAQLREHLG